MGDSIGLKGVFCVLVMDEEELKHDKPKLTTTIPLFLFICCISYVDTNFFSVFCSFDASWQV